MALVLPLLRINMIHTVRLSGLLLLAICSHALLAAR